RLVLLHGVRGLSHGQAASGRRAGGRILGAVAAGGGAWSGAHWTHHPDRPGRDLPAAHARVLEHGPHSALLAGAYDSGGILSALRAPCGPPPDQAGGWRPGS